AATLGSGAMTNSVEDLAHAEVMLVIGSNNTETHPVIGMRLKHAARYRGAKIIVVDPRRTGLVDDSVLWLSPPPGYDIAIVNAMAHVILEEGLHNEEYIEEKTEGFEEFRDALKPYTPEYAEELTGVPADDIRRAARLYGSAANAAIIYCMGITQHSKGTDNVKCLSNLALLCGQMGKRGSGVNPLRGQNNVQGACDMGGLPNVFTGYQKVGLPEVQGKFEKHWAVELSDKPGLTVVEMSNQMMEGNVKALYVMGENPLVTDPDLTHVEEAFEKLDLLVVQDIFLTETARAADVVLPATSFAEKDGTFSNTERRVQLVRKALDPPGSARLDWEILADISTRMGYEMSYSSGQDVFEEIREVTPQYAGITYKRLGREGLQWPCPDEKHPGTPILHTKGVTRGSALFVPIEFRPPAEVPDAEYPFVLTTGRDYYQYHSATMTGRVKLLRDACPESYLEMSPEDADKLGVSDMSVVKVSSRRGHVIARIKITPNLSAGIVFKKFHFYEGAVNRLTNPVLDPTSKIPELKVTAVRIEKHDGPAPEPESQGMCLM
ncbi:MAG: molybdopterin-dependent oxidoreductase, partial [Thermodesulfovibrionales bacterium]|nr:molybdopterin-dependent oxidoreductase [Thermodesulfovibrionales bacterium]